MDLLNHLALGFGTAFAPPNLLCALVGGLLGTLVGVLPGIGPVAAMAMLLPATYTLSPVSALILLAGIYYGAQYGGSIAAILLKRPNEPTSPAVGADGYQMARQGHAGSALAAAGPGTFFAGCVGVLVLAALAPVLTAWALQFGPAESFALMVLGLVAAVVLASGSLLKALGMLMLGLLLGLVGSDVPSGVVRFAFDMPELGDGIGTVVLAMGVFGYGEIISNLARTDLARHALGTKMQDLWPTRQAFREMAPSALRGTALGPVLGFLPGGSGLLAAFASFALEKAIRPQPNEVPLGTGNIRGVAAPESATRAAAPSAFVSLLALGIPSNAVMAVLMGAMALHKVPPGPKVMASNPELFWGLIASFWIGHLMLVLLNLPLMGLWARLLSVPYRWVFPAIVLLGAMGVYTLSGSTFGIWLLAGFGLVGYVFHKLGMAPAPLLLGFILGPGMEDKLRQALELSRGDWSVFVSRPLSAGLLFVALILLVLVLLPTLKAQRSAAFGET